MSTSCEFRKKDNFPEHDHKASAPDLTNIKGLKSSKNDDENAIGAKRIVTSEETPAPRDVTTAEAL